MQKRAVQIGLALVGGVLILFGVVFGGKAARDSLRWQKRYTVHFLDIDCPAPPHQERVRFLSEVQYLASMPSRLQLLDKDLPAQLTAAFARHPWVEKVEQIDLPATGQVRVKLCFRTPVLAVPSEGQLRAVDCHGILLPTSANTQGLPVFQGSARPYAGPAGTPWPDAAVEKAARMAAKAGLP
jgi:hypothetical protein